MCLGQKILIFVAVGSFSLLCAQENITEQILEQDQKLETRNVSENIDSPTKMRMVTYCSTPDQETGFCMPIMNCGNSKIKKLWKKNKKDKFLQASMCGPRNENKTNPFVCCGMQPKHVDNPFPKICGQQNVTMRGRILGGTEAKLGEFPWLARLYHKDRGGMKVFGCTGFLIAPKFILTAAHCLDSDNNHILGNVSEIHLGEHDTNTKIDCNSSNTTCSLKIERIGVKKMFVHPSYSRNSKDHHGDIGLIFLRKAANITKYVSPICLIDRYDFEPFEYWLSGWGRTETENLSHIKMKVSVPPFSHSNCTKKYGSLGVKIIDEQLCAGGRKNRDSCTGDSGGPLMLVQDKNHWFAAGVVSYGIGCGSEGWPAVYTNITSYYDWIKTTVLKHQRSNEKTKNTHAKN